jgi:hypothetical protein
MLMSLLGGPRLSYGLRDEQRNKIRPYKCLGVESYAADPTFEICPRLEPEQLVLPKGRI